MAELKANCKCGGHDSADMKQIYAFNKAEFGLQYGVKTLNGQDFIVVPVVMVVEGVLNNALYTEEELRKNVEMWNNKPLPIPSHPTNAVGEYVPANTPEMVEKHSVGQIMNAKVTKTDGIVKLVAEAWINIDRAAELSPELLERLESNQKIEVSTGLFTDAVLNPGEFKGNSYQWIVSNFRADHLAILMNEEGACSILDGCGLNANKLTQANILIQKALKKAKNVFSNNEASFNELRNSAESAIIKSINVPANNYVMVVDMFSTHFLYEVWNGDSHKGELFKIDYKVNNDEVVLDGTPVKGTIKKNFVSVETEGVDTNSSEDNEHITPNKGELKMEKLVKELINNSASPFEESDKDYLMTLNEDRLKQHISSISVNDDSDDSEEDEENDPAKVSANKDADDSSDKAPTVNASDLAEVLKQVVTLQASLPEMIANAVESKADADTKTPVVNKLVESGCKMSKDTLMKFNMADLKELQKAYNVNANAAYFGGPVSTMNANSEEDTSAPAKMPALFANGKAEEN